MEARLVGYQTHVQDFGTQAYVYDGAVAGTSGQAKRMESIRINLPSTMASEGKIEYRSHVQNIGWEKDWKQTNQLSGTTGKSLRLEAIQMKLSGDIAKEYDVYYRVHAQNFGWLGWAKNGEEAGTAGYSYRLEAQKIRSSRELHQQQKKLSFKNSRFYFLTIFEKPKGLVKARPFPIIFIEKHGKRLKNNEESVNMKIIKISKKQII